MLMLLEILKETHLGFPRFYALIQVFVLVGKFNLGELYEKIGFNKEIISRGRFAELTAAEQRPFR